MHDPWILCACQSFDFASGPVPLAELSPEQEKRAKAGRAASVDKFGKLSARLKKGDIRFPVGTGAGPEGRF